MTELFEPHAVVDQVACRRHFVFRYRSPEHWLDVFRIYYGPLLKTFAALARRRKLALEQDLVEPDQAIQSLATTVPWSCPSEYLEVVVTLALTSVPNCYCRNSSTAVELSALAAI